MAKTTHPVTRAALGIAALAAIAILANWLISLTPFGNKGVDFTENKILTLSEGTRGLVSELDTPVVIRYYATRNSPYMPEDLKIHMRRVDDLLKEYVSLSNGKIRVENIDPEPDTDAEDSANLDEISGQRINDENLYLGIAVACLDRTRVLPFLDPNQETMFEYELSKAISEVSTPKKPVVGVMSAFNLAGQPAMMPGQQGSPAWVVFQQLKQSYEVKYMPLNHTELDPKELKVLLVLHPAGITPEGEFAIDQYLLGGGTVIAGLDAFSVSAQMLSGNANPMMGQQGIPVSSTLPKLLPAWGVSFESVKVLADPTHATALGGNRQGLAVLSLPQSSMPQKDNVITKDLGSVVLFLPGAFNRTSGGGVSVNTLVRSSTEAGFVDAVRASQIDPTLATSLKPEGKAFDLVTHLSGKFKTAFPNGKPTAEGQEPKEEKKEGEDAKPTHLTESAQDGNVFLIADVDAFYDRFAYNVQNFGGMQMASPMNGNATMLFNIIDQAIGSKHLIGSRSRSALRRPFTVVQEMEAAFNKNVGAKITEFETKQKEAQRKLSELQAQKTQGSELYLSPEQEAEIRKLREEQVNYARMVRDQQKELRRQKDELGGRITLLNVAAMPALVVLFGFGLFLKRRSSTRAR
ncbi:Gldg family protein [Luteolibacter sp. SL250]|uniref:Gldg family protein n=1 Tax=Luteolibacter sp. SL250 TaxID=2995170 RepID=UPI00227001B0|nr:Gldg family protein [Luteolibacter sp. SL250]WAC21603.1 Gldg family protein [Luteolibacter sp. SL250]